MRDGLISRVLRALRLDPTLYREVAAPGASTEQAALVLMLAAVGFGFAHSADRIAGWLNYGWDGLPRVEANAWMLGQFENGRIIAHALGLMAAWPVWAVCLCLISKRMGPSDRPSPGLGQVARAIAFAQAPGLAGIVLLIPSTIASAFLVPDVSLPHLSGAASEIIDPLLLPWLGFLVNVGTGVLLIWVFVGTFVALREVVGLSQGQTFGVIALAAVSITVLVTVALTVTHFVAVAVGVVSTGLGSGPPVADRSDIAALVLAEAPSWVASAFDFSLGWNFLGELISRLEGMFEFNFGWRFLGELTSRFDDRLVIASLQGSPKG